MTDYTPPEQTYVLGQELDRFEAELADLEAEIVELDEQDDLSDADQDELQDKLSEQAQTQRWKRAVEWAIHGDERTDFDGWGSDAEITIRGYDGLTRDRVSDGFDRTVVNGGTNEFDTWLTAAGITDAPWIDDADIASKAQATQGLHPSFIDWLESLVSEVNRIQPGN